MSFIATPMGVFISVISPLMASTVVLNLSTNSLNNFIMVFYNSLNSSARPSLSAIELSGLLTGLELLVGATLSTSESTINISSLIGNPCKAVAHCVDYLNFFFLHFLHSCFQRPVLGTSLRNNISSSIKISRSTCHLGAEFVVDMVSVFNASRS